MNRIQTETVKIPLDEQNAVSAVMAWPNRSERAERDCVVWAHGAGADMHHPFISYFHESIAQAGWLSIKFNFLYKEQGRKAPDSAGKLENTFTKVLDFVQDRAASKRPRFFLGGKSMGGRIASQVVAKGRAVDGLVFLGYPLHPPKRHDRLRAEHLSLISCPMLFVEGTRDPLCDLDLLTQTLRKVAAPTEIYWIESGNHDFRVPKKLGRTSEEILEEVAGIVCDALKRWGRV